MILWLSLNLRKLSTNNLLLSKLSIIRVLNLMLLVKTISLDTRQIMLLSTVY